MFLTDRLQIPSQRSYTDEGYLSVPSRIGRTGIQEYLAVEMGLTDREPSTIIRVYRSPEEVFRDESLQSFANKPITNEHPPTLLNAANTREFSVGMSDKEVTQDGDFIRTIINVIDGDAIKAIEGGKVELSNGYTADVEFIAGVTTDGLQYDAVQTNIRGNHIAIVARGRAGANCRVSDSAYQGEDKLMKISIKGVDYEVTDQVAQAVGNLQAENRTLADQTTAKEAETEAARLEREEAVATSDAMKVKLDDAIAAVPTAAVIDTMVADRNTLITKALLLAPTLNWEGKDRAVIMAEVVAAKCPGIQMDSKTPEYIKTRFEILTEDSAAGVVLDATPLTAALNVPYTKDTTKVEDTRPAHVIAREKSMADSRDAYKNPHGKAK